MTRYVLAIDQGTTSSRAMLFDGEFRIVAMAQEEFPQHYPRSGWVEHDPEEIWAATVRTCRQAIARAGAAADIAAIGIANQRETVVVWERATGRPIHNAIVWQDRRTSEICRALKEAGHESRIRQKTGLLLDPYFSATKVAWMLDHLAGARERAEAGELAFGTIDSFLLWRLTGGKLHATDATNASRTMLYDIHAARWCEGLLALLRVPEVMLPEVRDSAADFGTTAKEIFGVAIPIRGVAGDQQAAVVGQACFVPGMMKATYGTGCFALLNTGDEPVHSGNRLLTTVAYRLAGRSTFALEGSIFIAGAAVQWLRDGIEIIDRAAHSGELAGRASADQDIYLVPAFVGLGAPHWDSDCRGAIFGLTRDTGRAEFARAALECVCYQTRDLLEAMRRDWATAENTVLRVDGGMVASEWMLQCLADILNAPVDRPRVLETTALGAAYLAGLQSGYYPPPDAFAENWTRDSRYLPTMTADQRERKYRGWSEAVRRTLSR